MLFTPLVASATDYNCMQQRKVPSALCSQSERDGNKRRLLTSSLLQESPLHHREGGRSTPVTSIITRGGPVCPSAFLHVPLLKGLSPYLIEVIEILRRVERDIWMYLERELRHLTHQLANMLKTPSSRPHAAAHHPCWRHWTPVLAREQAKKSSNRTTGRAHQRRR